MDKVKIYQYISSGELQKAVELIMHKLPKNHGSYNGFLLFNSRISAITNVMNEGIIKVEDYKLELNKITKGILELLDQLEIDKHNKEDDKGDIEKLLFLSAKPKLTTDLKIENEYLQVRKSLKRKKVAYEITEELDVSLDDFFDEIKTENPSVIHFSGHATKDFMVLTDKRNYRNIDRVPWQYLLPPFKLISKEIKCVFFHACETSEIAKELSKFIPFVIGIKGVVPNEDAIKFSPAFYSSLSFKTDFKLAFTNACDIIKKRFQKINLPIKMIDYIGQEIEYTELGAYCLYINGEEINTINNVTR